ncbi:MAG TPA: glycosyltransferase domain-containing protein [Sporichthya sp.]|jgi:hypothetical protein|nr:glycosyltransferase domain-containing protein [Sporichthya sp.]
MITVVTAAYGGYDFTQPAPVHPEIASMVVTDSRDVGEARLDAGWQEMCIQPVPHVHPRLAAKVPKCKPWDFWLSPTETVVWIDAAARITNVDRFVEAVKSVPMTQAMGQFKHPDRDDVMDEAVVSETMHKYRDQEVLSQARTYLWNGLPRHWGLWATGMIVYHPAAYDHEAFGNAWLAEQLSWTYQDQISEPYLLWRAGYRPFELPGHLRTNDYVAWMSHTRDD